MKSISFDAESRAAIERGDKTVTRRLANGKPCRYRVGETLYVSDRWRMAEKDATLFVEVVSVRRERLSHLETGYVWHEELVNEGYILPDGAIERDTWKAGLHWWVARWNSHHKEPGTRYEDNPDVYRIEFKVVKS